MDELSFGGLLNQTFEEYKNHFVIFFKILLLLYLLPSTILTIATVVFTYSLNAVSLTKDMNTILSLGIPGIILIVTIVVINILLMWLMYIAIIKIISYRRANQEVTFGKIIEDSKKYLGSYALLSILMGLALLVLFILLIIPGIIFSVYWSFAAFILVLENKGITESMSESKKLVKGRWWTVFGYSFLFGIIVVGISFVCGLIIGIPSFLINLIPLIGPIISQVLSDSITMFILPLGIIFSERFYQKLKSLPPVADSKKQN